MSDKKRAKKKKPPKSGTTKKPASKASKKRAATKKISSKEKKMLKDLEKAKKELDVEFLDPGPRPKLVLLKKEELNVDTVYQRGWNLSYVVRKAQTFRYFLCGVLLVMQRPNGSYYIVDGQQRWRAAMRRDDIKTLACAVIKADGTTKDEAKAFLEAAKAWKLSAYHKHRAMFASDDPTALLMERAANKVGYKIVPMSRKGKNTVGCVSCMRNQAKKLPDVFVELFDLCAKIYDGKPIDKTILRGLGWGEYNFRRQREGKTSFLSPKCKKALIRIGSSALKQRIVTMAAAMGSGGVHGGSGGMAPTNGIIAALNDEYEFGIPLF